MALFEEIGDDLGLGNVLLNIGFSLSFEGRWAESIEHYRASHDTFERCGDVIGMAYTLNNRAEILTDQGRNDDARALLIEARRVYLRAAGYRIGVTITTSGSPAWTCTTAISTPPEHDFDALGEFADLGSDSYTADTRVRLVELHLAAGHLDQATPALAAARAAATATVGDVQLPIALARFTATDHACRGDADTARVILAEALDLARAYPAPYEVGAALDLWRRLDEETGREPDPVALDELDRIATRLGVVRWPPTPVAPTDRTGRRRERIGGR